jgi:hypothetical protein
LYANADECAESSASVDILLAKFQSSYTTHSYSRLTSTVAVTCRDRGNGSIPVLIWLAMNDA